ncbi:MAG: ribosome biogenesis protein [Nitrososphaerota archaeon]|nr:ribosome biogenesis protein [Nitrososphaerota archaeon]
MLNLIIAEAALELVPPEIAGHASVRNDAERRGAKTSEILLDRSIHHHAMLKLPESEKRGRPDLVHLTLLSVTSTPLYLSGRVKVFIHTRENVVLELKEGTRPPKSYARFRDLARKLLVERPESGLIVAHDSTIPELLSKIKTDLVVGLSTQGRISTFDEVAVELLKAVNPTVLVGGFPKGHFTSETMSWLHLVIRVHPDALDAHVVAARLIYEVERARAQTEQARNNLRHQNIAPSVNAKKGD